MVEAGANVNDYLEDEELTPLKFALDIGRTDIVEFLLDKGAHIDDIDFVVGNTPLMEAVIKGDIEMVKFLILKGADIHTQNFGGYTAYILAKKYRQKEIAKELKIAAGIKHYIPTILMAILGLLITINISIDNYDIEPLGFISIFAFTTLGIIVYVKILSFISRTIKKYIYIGILILWVLVLFISGIGIPLAIASIVVFVIWNSAYKRFRKNKKKYSKINVILSIAIVIALIVLMYRMQM